MVILGEQTGYTPGYTSYTGYTGYTPGSETGFFLFLDKLFFSDARSGAAIVNPSKNM